MHELDYQILNSAGQQGNAQHVVSKGTFFSSSCYMVNTEAHLQVLVVRKKKLTGLDFQPSLKL